LPGSERGLEVHQDRFQHQDDPDQARPAQARAGQRPGRDEREGLRAMQMNQAKGKSNRRKLGNLLINPRFQLKYVFWIAGTGAALSAFNAIVFYRYVKENYDTLVQLAPMTDEA